MKAVLSLTDNSKPKINFAIRKGDQNLRDLHNLLNCTMNKAVLLDNPAN